MKQFVLDIGFENIYHLLPEVAQERYFKDCVDGLTWIIHERATGTEARSTTTLFMNNAG